MTFITRSLFYARRFYGAEAEFGDQWKVTIAYTLTLGLPRLPLGIKVKKSALSGFVDNFSNLPSFNLSVLQKCIS